MPYVPGQGSDFQIGNYRFVNVFPEQIAAIIAWVNTQPARTTVGDFTWTGSAGVPVGQEPVVPVGTPLGTPPGTPIEGLRAESERGAGALENIYRQALATDPRYQGLSVLGQRAMERQSDPTQLNYELGLIGKGAFGEPLTSGGGPGQRIPATSFYDWLRQGNPAQTSRQQLNQLDVIAGMIGQQGLQGQNQALAEAYRNNAYAQQQYLIPFQNQLAPYLRGFAPQLAQTQFDIFQAQTPEGIWAKELARRGGFFQ